MTTSEKELCSLVVRESLKMLDYCILSDKSTEDDILRQTIQCRAQIDLLKHVGMDTSKFETELNTILS